MVYIQQECNKYWCSENRHEFHEIPLHDFAEYGLQWAYTQLYGSCIVRSTKFCYIQFTLQPRIWGKEQMFDFQVTVHRDKFL